MEAGPSSGKARFNSILGVLFFTVVGLVFYSVVIPWNRGFEPSGSEEREEGEKITLPDQSSPDDTSKDPIPETSGTTTSARMTDNRAFGLNEAVSPGQIAANRDNPQPNKGDSFAEDWSYRSLVGDIVEMDFGNGTVGDVRVGQPFDSPEGETAAIVEIKPDGKTVIVERESDGMRFPVPKLVRIDLTTLEPKSAEAYRFSVNKLVVPKLKELAEPHIDGRKVFRYFLAVAPSTVVFELREPYTRFRAKGYLGHNRGEVKFVVKADGAVLYSSDPMSTPGSVDIEVVFPKSPRILELVVDPLGPNTADHSFWLEPVLEK